MSKAIKGEAVLQTLSEALDGHQGGNTLVWGRGLGAIARSLRKQGVVHCLFQDARDSVEEGDAFASYGVLAPTSEQHFERIVMRLPKSKDDLRWRLRAAAAALPEGGKLWLAGHQREGIKSALKLMEELVGKTVTQHTKRRCRVLVAHRDAEVRELPCLEQEARRVPFTFAKQSLEGVTLPGVFAHGRVDEGTARLLDWLQSQKLKGRVLDLGAGAGIIGVALATLPRVNTVHMVDSSWSAVEAMKRTIEANRAFVSGDTLITTQHSEVSGSQSGAYDVVVTNPPFHDGREEDRELIARFAQVAAQRMRARACFYAVCNTHLPYREALLRAFVKVDVAWEDNRFRVWSCRVART